MNTFSLRILLLGLLVFPLTLMAETSPGSLADVKTLQINRGLSEEGK